MERPLRLALHQLNPTVGDLAGNALKVRDGLRAAREAGAQLSLFPELMITGYPPEDLLIKEHFRRDARETLDDVASEARDLVAIVGFPERAEDVYNAAAVLADGRVQAIYRKVQLPNYGVFDEVRYFQAGPAGAVIDVGAERPGLPGGEDTWGPGPPATGGAPAGAPPT